ncbi:MAG: flagellar motor protein MotB, partial [Clostridiaceae bacterium]|nr:flagellar motor protein MotB [Clostridiaceae bacterium]
MARKRPNREKPNTDRWLATYADMMNNLLVLFMVLYAMSVMDLEKFKALAVQFNNKLASNTVIETQ